MTAKELIRLPDPRRNVHIDIREVVRDVVGKPHIFLRVRVTGWYFPHRAPEPFLLIGEVVSRNVIVSGDGLTADAYFDTTLPDVKQVSAGYGNIINWDFEVPIRAEAIRRLDRSRIPKGTIDQISPRQ